MSVSILACLAASEAFSKCLKASVVVNCDKFTYMYLLLVGEDLYLINLYYVNQIFADI